MPGIPELLLILVIALVIFGAGKLPAIGDSLGRSIKNFKRAAGGQDELEVGKKTKASELEAGDEYAEVVAKRSTKPAASDE